MDLPPTAKAPWSATLVTVPYPFPELLHNGDLDMWPWTALTLGKNWSPMPPNSCVHDRQTYPEEDDMIITVTEITTRMYHNIATIVLQCCYKNITILLQYFFCWYNTVCNILWFNQRARDRDATLDQFLRPIPLFLVNLKFTASKQPFPWTTGISCRSYIIVSVHRFYCTFSLIFVTVIY